MPALLTSTPRPPSPANAATSSIIGAIVSGRVRSAPTATARPPMPSISATTSAAAAASEP